MIRVDVGERVAVVTLAIAADLRVAAPCAVLGVPTAEIGLAVDPWTIRAEGRPARTERRPPVFEGR